LGFDPPDLLSGIEAPRFLRARNIRAELRFPVLREFPTAHAAHFFFDLQAAGGAKIAS